MTAPAVSEHVLSHLSPASQAVAVALAGPETMDEVVARVGYSSRRVVEDHWQRIRDRLGLCPDDRQGHGNAGSGAANRVALVRMLYGIDPCFCGRAEP